MDLPHHTNPLEAVQLISVFSYLSLLSDFLFSEHYLSEDNQNKQIPVVNALYEYLQIHNDNLDMKAKLIRALLQGSDLYGEKANENFDVIFANSMFEYIISSLVFQKYANLYVFIVDVVYKAKNLQIDSLLIDLKNALKAAKFENEYGNSSSLSSLSVDRIFTDIILPFFPQPKTNLNLTSADYIYAQAGAIFLRFGRINTTYYTNLTNYQVPFLDNENLFDEYVLTGYTLEHLLFSQKFDLSISHAFLLPALCYYAFTEKGFLRNANIKSVIFDIFHLQMAYEVLFFFLHSAFNDIEIQLNKDNIYQIHEVLSNFKGRNIIARYIINLACSQLSQEDRERSIDEYTNNPENYHCDKGRTLPKINDWFESEINNLIEKYDSFESESIKKAFGDSFIKSISSTKISINLFEDSKKSPHDLLEFYFPINNTVEYYALLREDYTSKLIKESDDPQNFQEMVGFTVEEWKKNTSSDNLKNENETFTKFLNALITYKINRLKVHLNYSDDNPIKQNWWKEFGFSLVPYYNCLSDKTAIIYHNFKPLCKIDTLLFLTKNKNIKDINSKIINKDTRSLVSLKGTTLKTFFSRKFYQIGKRNLATDEENNDFYIHEKHVQIILESLEQNAEKIGLGLTFSAFSYTYVLRSILDSAETYYSNVKSIINMLDNMDRLELNLLINLESPENQIPHNLSVRSQNLRDSTGYGYKFINLSVTRIAQLRSNFELNIKILVSLDGELSTYEKVYNRINESNLTIVPNEKYYEQNNQLRINSFRHSFSGIATPHYNYVDCDIDEFALRPITVKICHRIKRRSNKRRYENEVVQLVLNKTNLSEENIRRTIRRYVFPETNRYDLQFVQHWILNENFKEPKWAEDYLIENQTQLSELRYKMRLEIFDVTFDDANFRIQKIYTAKERHEIEGGTRFSKIVEEYNNRRAYFSATFEDYYALHNYATTGYTKITGDTNESRQMKIALYRLAIRQSDDPDEEFDLTLYKVEYKSQEFIERSFYSGQKVFKLRKFTIASTRQLSTIKFATILAPNFKPILYEMKFFGPYVRAKIEVFSSLHEKQSILLPGINFDMRKPKEEYIAGIGDVLKVELVHKHSNNEKYLWYKTIVTKLVELNLKQ